MTWHKVEVGLKLGRAFSNSFVLYTILPKMQSKLRVFDKIVKQSCKDITALNTHPRAQQQEISLQNVNRQPSKSDAKLLRAYYTFNSIINTTAYPHTVDYYPQEGRRREVLIPFAFIPLIKRCSRKNFQLLFTRKFSKKDYEYNERETTSCKKIECVRKSKEPVRGGVNVGIHCTLNANRV